MTFYRVKKKLGQIFLKDPAFLNRIYQSISIKENDELLEIGPGLGVLTQYLLKNNPKQLTAVEIDKDLIPFLQAKFKNQPNIHIICQDILNFKLDILVQKQRVVGNLPYNITSHILFHLITQITHIQDLHIMVQTEVAQRMAAYPGPKIYGRLSVMLQYYFDIEILFHLPSRAFSPSPKVNSSMVRLIPHQKPKFIANDMQVFKTIVSTAFNQRRKTLGKTLKIMIGKLQWDKIDINPTLRPESLSVEQYVSIANLIVDEGNT